MGPSVLDSVGDIYCTLSGWVEGVEVVMLIFRLVLFLNVFGRVQRCRLLGFFVKCSPTFFIPLGVVHCCSRPPSPFSAATCSGLKECWVLELLPCSSWSWTTVGVHWVPRRWQIKPGLVYFPCHFSVLLVILYLLCLCFSAHFLSNIFSLDTGNSIYLACCSGAVIFFFTKTLIFLFSNH